MHTMRDTWTDERLDEFGNRIEERFDRVDERFAQIDRRFDEMGREVDRRFNESDKRLDRLADGLESMQKAIVFGSVTISSAFVAGLFALVLQR